MTNLKILKGYKEYIVRDMLSNADIRFKRYYKAWLFLRYAKKRGF